MSHLRSLVRRSGLLCALLFTLTALTPASDAGAQVVRFVNAAAPSGGDGLTWATAYSDLHSAIGDPDAEQLWIAAGTYKPASWRSGFNAREYSFVMRNNLALYGGFNGTETSLDQRNIDANETTLSGDLNGDDGPYAVVGTPTWLADNSYHVIRATIVDGSARLDGLTISGGAAVTTSEVAGGGLYAFDARPAIERCRFIRNYALGGGGAVYLTTGSSATIASCQFINNRVFDGYHYLQGGGGGALCANESNPVISDCVFEANNGYVTFGGGGATTFLASHPVFDRCVFRLNIGHDFGGAIYIYSGSLEVAQCDFIDNYASYSGGGIFASESNTSVNGCRFAFETMQSVEGGAGIAVHHGVHTIQDCAFERLRSEGGGAVSTSSAIATITDCRFSNNTATLFGGGAIWGTNYDNPANLLTVINCLFEGNGCRGIAQYEGPGGAILSGTYVNWGPDDARTIIQGCTFVDNDAGSDAGGAVHAIGPGWTAICDSIMQNNTPLQTAATSGAFLTVADFCSCEGDADHSGTIDLDDLLGVMLSWGLCPECPPVHCPGDIAPYPVGNCIIDVDDLIAVILHWGACP